MGIRRWTALVASFVLSTGGISAGRAAAAEGQTFTVTTTANAGAGSLRQAVIDANGNANQPLVDRIVFAIPGNGPHTIVPTSSFAGISEPVVIDGYTQGDATPGVAGDDARPNDETGSSTNAVIKIVLDGTSAGGTTSGFNVDSDDVAIRGLAINSFLFGVLTSGNRLTIVGNFIGTDATGQTDEGNAAGAIGVSCISKNILIGGPSPADTNLISGNDGSSGAISTGSTGCKRVTIQNNLIGTTTDGASALGNSTAPAVLIRGTANGKMRITDNVIAHNAGPGITINFGGSDMTISGNSIFNNGGLGIDLDGGGVTPNDPKDTDTGSNGRQNFPVLTSAESDGGLTTIKGTLASGPDSSYKIEVFSNTTADPSGNGEGQTHLGTVSVNTNAKGVGKFKITVADPPAGHDLITATATEKRTGNTSEFSEPVPVT